MEIGWIKIHRSLIDWEWYEDLNVRVLFIHLLLTVNFEDKKWRGLLIKKGSRITGRLQLSSESGLSEQQVRTAIKKLQSTNDLTTENNLSGTMFTINNWNKYQQSTNETTAEQPDTNQTPTNQQPDSNQAATITKEVKNLKNDKETESAIGFLKAKYPSRFETDFMMKHSRKIKDRGWKKRRKQKDLPFEQSEKDATALKSQSENDVIREEKRREEKKTEEKKTESAIGFLKAKYPSRFETDFMMKHSRQIKDRNQFFELFNNKCDVETLEFTGRILFARLNSFSINWIRNQSKSTTGKSPTDISL